jgi:glycosyltransferase involved in cell wall biosynthesis
MLLTIGYSTRKIDENFLKHIKDTVGLKENEYEIIPIENNGVYGLSEAYNIILDKSKSNIVVLMHDDIKIEPNWGKKLLLHFNKDTHDIIGVAGTTNFPKSGMWWENKESMTGIVKHSKDGKTWVNKYSESQGYDIKSVVIVDGLFIAFDKTKIKHKFDEEFKGFHFYDIAFCFPNYIDGINIGVVTDIRITHLSIGETNQQWEENRKQFIEKYKLNNNISTSPLVSIIIPCHNDGQFLKDSIQSSKNFDYPNKEIIIINDGSTDENTINILKVLENDNTLKIIHNEINKGLAASRNIGINNSNGYYILPHDVDDTFHPKFLSLAVIEAEKYINISPVYCDTNHIGFIEGIEKRPEWSLQRLKQGPFIVSCSLFRKDAWKRVGGYDESMKAWEDYDIWWRMGNKGFKGIRIPHPLFNYRHIRPSMIQNINNEQELYNYIMNK